jgi:hypothetical protein
MTFKSLSRWMLGSCCRQLRRSSADVSTVCSRAERVFILEYNFAVKSFSAVSETFSNAQLGQDVSIKTIDRLVTEFRAKGCVYGR